MTALVPSRFLFHFEFPLRYRRVTPAIDGDVGQWSQEFLLPKLGEIDGRRDFADVWACWNDDGLCIACRVVDKLMPLRCDPRSFWTGDNLRLCLCTREARTIKRATRYCRQFFFLPTGGGTGQDRPLAGVNKFQSAHEAAPPVPVERIVTAARVTGKGYTLEAHIPSVCLTGFDPSAYPRMGFYYILEDGDHGQQYLTIGDDLYWYVDPSTWATAVLQQ